MALIHILDKQTDEIIGTLDVGDYTDDNRVSSLDNQNTFEFVALKHFDILQKRNRLLLQDLDGFFHEYVITYTDQFSRKQKIVQSNAAFLDLKKAKVIEPQTLEGATAATATQLALAGTEYRPGQIHVDRIRTIHIEEHTNPYALLKRISSEFDQELRFRVVIERGNQISRYVDLVKPNEEFSGKEIRFGKDLIEVRRKEDSSRIVTALLGIGPEREDGTRLTVFVEDRDALQRWGRNGQHLIEVYEPQSEDANMTLERLTQLTEAELKKRTDSIVEYQCQGAILEHLLGKEHEKIRLGDTIRIKDEGYTPPLYLEARIQEINEKPSLNRIVSFKLGNYKEFQKEDLEAQIDTLKKLLDQKASTAKLTEVYESALQHAEEKASQAEQNAKEYADTQDLQVKAEVNQYAEQQAQQAEENAKEYTDDRLENTVAKDIFENTVTDLLNNIAQKVDSTRFEQVESELRGIAEGLQHEVAEHADTLEEHGGKITKLETDVDEVEGKINATISELEALDDTVSRHETQINANAREIALKADKQELDLLSGTVSDISSELSVMAGKIEAKAERSEVEKLENDVSKVSQDVSKLTVDVDGIKTNVSSISQTVSNHGTQISNINSTLTQHADMIASKVEKSEFDSVTNTLGNRISTIEQTADSISLEVSDIKANVYTKSEVDSAIDELEIGGRNLLKSSRLIRPYSNNHSEYPISYTLMTEGERQFYRVVRTKTHSDPTTMSLYNSIPVTNITQDLLGQTVTFSFRARASHNVNSNLMFAFTGGSNDRKDMNYHGSTFQITTSWKTYSFTVTIDFSIYNSNLLRFTPWQITIPSGEIDNFYLDLCEFKIELGNKATDWTPAPEDIDEKFTDIEGTLASHSTKIEQNAQQIQLRATKTEVDTLTSRISSVEGELNLMPDKISSRIAETAIGLVGSNLIPNGSFELDHFGWKSGGTIVNDGHSGSKSLRVNALSSGYQRKNLSQLIPVIPGRTYEISFWAKTSSDSNGTADNQKLRIGKKDGSIITQATIGWDGARTDWTKFSKLWTVPSDITEIHVSIVNNHTEGWVQWDDISIVDVTNENEVRQYAESQITQLAGQIELRATKTEVDALSGRVSTVESTIQQHADMIESKIDDGQARSIFRQEASSFTFAAEQINFEGSVFGEDATFAGTLRSQYTDTGTNYIYTGNLNPTELTFTAAEDNILRREMRISAEGIAATFDPGNFWSIYYDGSEIQFASIQDGEASGVFNFIGSDIKLNGVSIIDAGGDSTSGYIRFANGIQLCWGWIQAGVTVGTDWVWWLPAPFIDANYTVFAQPHRNVNDNQYFILRTRQLYQDRVSVRIVYTTSGISGTQQYAQFIAVGRWK